jgi:hypothetical protein
VAHPQFLQLLRPHRLKWCTTKQLSSRHQHTLAQGKARNLLVVQRHQQDLSSSSITYCSA